MMREGGVKAKKVEANFGQRSFSSNYTQLKKFTGNLKFCTLHDMWLVTHR